MSSVPPDPELTHLTGKHIIIAGAGIAGLSFTLSLHKLWPSQAIPVPRITIVERDSQRERVGREGYTLSIRSDGDRGGGVQVLDDLGLYEKVSDAGTSTYGKHSKDGLPAKGRMILWDKHWNELLRVDATKVKNMSKRKLQSLRIRRNALQTILADAVAKLNNVEILWSRAITNVEQRHESGRISALLGDGSSLQCDILIAADGAKSKVRGLIRPKDGLQYQGVVVLLGTARFGSREQIPGTLATDWGAVLGWTGIGLFVAPVDETSSLWALSYKSPSPREVPARPYSRQITEELLNEARGLGEFAGARLRTLIDASDPSTVLVFNAQDRPPFAHDFAKHKNIIFIGDSNHAVTPFAGNGANMAMIDGWDLAKELVSSSSIDSAVQTLEKTMIPRMNAVLRDSHWNMGVGHAEGWKATMYWLLLKIVSFFT